MGGWWPQSNRAGLDDWATVRLARAGDDVRGAVTDLLFASSGIEPEVVGFAEALGLVTRRGFHRERDLSSALQSVITELGA